MSENNAPEQKVDRIVDRMIEDEMQEAFIDYSMSVIVQRALPDVRDGLKPVHRRILYSMHESGLHHNRSYKKSATVVGDVLGKYHPHGDSAVYDSLVRMVQDFSLRYPLIDGQGNYGSIDGDSPAAYRYTEARLARIASEILADIDRETVNFVPNFDDRLLEPTVLPSRIPNLLVNGSSGIAVGMATNIPPHNLGEVVRACVHLLENPEASIDELMQFVPGPDFPTGGLICGRDGIMDAYHTGRGRVVMRARAEIEEREDGRERIVITEIPFMVNKARLIEHIAELCKEKKITDISHLRDESDRDGMRIVIDLKRDSMPQVVLNQLYKHTQMQSTFGVIMLSLVNGAPRVLTLKQMLEYFLEHRHEVVIRRTQFDLNKALDREHILEGLKIAVDNIDEVIQIIRASATTEEAGIQLRARFGLTERQTDAILNMRLAKLTGLEIEQLEAELTEVRATIADLRDILARRERRVAIIKEELEVVAERYGNERRSQILGSVGTFSLEDLIPDEEMVITVSHTGYIKRVAMDTYRAQNRGGRGINGMDTKDEDWVEHVFVASTHDDLVFFTRQGQCYKLKVYEIPQGSRNSRGKPIVNLLENFESDDKIAAFVAIRGFASEQTLFFVTRKGIVKKTPLSAYANIRPSGIIAMNILEDDELIDVRLTSGEDEIILATREGIAIRFSETDVRETSRDTMGVRGINLRPEDEVVGMVVANPESTLLVVTELGMGKRTALDAYRFQKRGGNGVINIKVSEKTGRVVAIKEVKPEDELMLMTRSGIINRQNVDGIRVIGRNTQGVKLMNLDDNDAVVDVARIVLEEAVVEEALVEEAVEDQSQIVMSVED